MERVRPFNQPLVHPRLSLQSWSRWVVVAYSLVAVGLFLLTTHQGNLMLTNDSVNFLSGSRGILQGRGFLRYWEAPTASWPPLYPLLISGLTVLIEGSGHDVVGALRYVHALVYGLTILAAGELFLRYIPSRLFALLGLVAVLCSSSLWLVLSNVWTESLFILLSLIFFLYLPKFLEERKWWQFTIVCAATFMGTMQRFAGVGMLPAGCLSILLFMRGVPLLKRFLYAFIFGLMVIPTMIWIGYGMTLPGEWGMSQVDPVGMLVDSVYRITSMIGIWFLPETLRTPVLNFIVALLVLALLVGILVAYYRATRQNPADVSVQKHPVLFVVYLLSFVAFLLFYMMVVYNTPLNERHLSIFYIYVMLLVFWALEKASRLRPVRWQKYALVGLTAVWLIYPMSRYAGDLNGWQYGCCDAIGYRDLPVVEWLETHPLNGKLYSNTAIPLIYTTLPVYGMPPQDDVTLDAWIGTALSPDADTYVIWFESVENLVHQGHDRFYYNITYGDRLAEAATMDVVAEFDGVKIVRLRAKQPAS